MKPAFAIVGCGRVGTALARYLSLMGYVPVGFSSRSVESAKWAAEAAGFGGEVSNNPLDIIGDADVVFITTPDSAIAPTAEEIAGHMEVKKDAVVLHCSGALPSTVLSPLKDAGAVIGSMHPLQSFVEESLEVNPFEGIMMAVEGEERAVDTAWRIAENLGATPFEIQTDGKVLYHASAVVASNYLVTLMHLSFQLLFASGVRSTHVYEILKPLVQGTLSNIKNVGIPRALTGPIARGDVDVIRSHLKELAQKTPTMLPLYKTLGEQTISIAKAKGTLSDEAADELKRLLSEE